MTAIKKKDSEKGVALLLAIFIMMLIVYLATEITYETTVEYTVNANSMNQIKAYYAAKAGVELSLLRIKMYQQVSSQMSNQMPAQFKQYIEMIWSMPFQWPPIVGAEVNRVDQENIEDKAAESLMKESYRTSISDEGSKIDINDLGSYSASLRDYTMKMLTSHFENKTQNDENFAKQFQNFDYLKVINNIKDWVDADTESSNGGAENQYYQNLGSNEIPPNRSFRTLEELRMVSGVTEEFFQEIKGFVTVYGSKSINPNTAPVELIKAIHPTITEEVIAKFNERRNDPEQGPFQDEKDFWGFLNSVGAQIDEPTQKATPIIVERTLNFKITSSSQVGTASKTIEAIVYDLSGTAEAVAKNLIKEDTASNPNPNPNSNQGGSGNQTQPNTNPLRGGSGTQTSKKEPLPKGPPRIVYWTEY